MAVNFDKDSGILELSGSSYPENALDFFNPLIQWIREYIEEIDKKIEMNIRLNYLNTSSTKCILDIFEIFQGYHSSGGHIKINWYYEEEDEDIMETGEELGEDFEFPISFIAYKNNPENPDN